MSHPSPRRGRAPGRAAPAARTLVVLVTSGLLPSPASAEDLAGTAAGGVPAWLGAVLALVLVLVAAGLGLRRGPRGTREGSGRRSRSTNGGAGVAPLAAPLSGPAPGAVVLRATGGPLRGNRFVVGPEGVRIGRDPSLCHIVLSDPSASREHALVRSRRGRLTIRNLSETNPTWVNGRSVQEATLSAGDVVRIAGSVFQVAAPTPPAPSR